MPPRTTPISALFPALALAAVALTACSKPERPEDLAALDLAYGTLHTFLADAARVDEILLIKSPDDSVEQLIRDIADSAGAAALALKDKQSLDPPVTLETPEPMPTLEGAAREASRGRITRELLFSGGDRFRTRLLVSQAESMRRAALLTSELARLDPNPQRTTWLREQSKTFDDLYQRVLELLGASESGDSQPGPT